jgi:hypothetical protein
MPRVFGVVFFARFVEQIGLPKDLLEFINFEQERDLLL